jgi:hypothetical protein
MAQTRRNYERIEVAANEMMSVPVSAQSTVVNYRHKANSSWLKISGASRPWPEARPIE